MTRHQQKQSQHAAAHVASPQDTAESPVKRAMGGVWLEATRTTKAVGGRGSKDRQLAVWKEETRNILKKIIFTADQGSLLQDIRNTDASSNS